MVIKNLTKNTTLVDRGRVADTFFSRLKGLLGSPALIKGEGLLLKHEKSIHTFFMSFPIDVVYINQAWQIINLDHNMPPYRLGRFVPRSVYILELPAGVIEETQTAVGDQLQVLNGSA